MFDKMEQKNNLELVRNELKLTNRDFAKLLGVHETQYSKMKRGAYPIGDRTINKIKRTLPNYNPDWVLFNKGDKYLPEGETMQLKTRKIASNAKLIGDLLDEMEYEDEDGNTIFKEIGPGKYKMKVQLVSEHAKAGYLNGFRDPEYQEELPFTEIIVNFKHKSHYLAFEASGDSMDDGTIKCIPDGTVLVCREINPELWKSSKLHSHRWPNWIFVHKYEGILVKQIASQNLETGEIVLRSLNPDKELYPDQTINVKDVYKVFNVVKRELQD